MNIHVLDGGKFLCDISKEEFEYLLGQLDVDRQQYLSWFNAQNIKKYGPYENKIMEEVIRVIDNKINNDNKKNILYEAKADYLKDGSMFIKVLAKSIDAENFDEEDVEEIDEEFDNFCEEPEYHDYHEVNNQDEDNKEDIYPAIYGTFNQIINICKYIPDMDLESSLYSINDGYCLYFHKADDWKKRLTLCNIALEHNLEYDQDKGNTFRYLSAKEKGNIIINDGALEKIKSA